jgi:membrane associated rhomboid family serine protease
MSTAYKKIISLVIVPIYLVILWVVHILKLTFNLNLSSYGVIARDWSGVKGIFTAPFIHGSIQHLMSNSVPLFVLSTMIIVFYRKVAYQSILLIYVMTGTAVWLFSRSYVSHIGASGVVYGLVSFVFWSGLFRRNIKSIVLALIVTILYSGYALGVLPNQKGISWESHLFGAFVGIIVAFWYRDIRESDEEDREPSWANDGDADTQYFLDRDAFEMTREERRRAQLEDDISDIWTSDNS